MLQSIHDKAKGILGMIIVGFLALVFGLWGIGDYLTDASEKYAAKVGDTEISQSEFEQNVSRERQRLEQRFDGQLPNSLVFEQSIKEKVLDQLITQRVLQQMVVDQGYRITDVVLAEKIKNIDAFQENGVFTNNAYEAVIQSQGRTIRAFEKLYRGDLAITQIQDAVMQSSIVGQGELNVLNQILQQSREIAYLQFDDLNYMKKIDVTDEQIIDYYDDNQSRYMHPEMVNISYVELKSADLVKDIAVDDEVIQRLYDEYRESMSRRETRKTSHILLQLEADAIEVLARISNGESFAELAKEKSEDPGSAPKGGDLGWVPRGMMTEEFENALFKLKKGQLSDVVSSSFGFHIIRLDDVKAVVVESFETKKIELIAQFKEQRLEDSFYEKSELMATTAYESDQSLQEVADALDLEIKTIAAFSRAQGTGIANNDKVRRAAFNVDVINDGRNSDIVEINDGHVLVLRVDEHKKAQPKSLDEVKNIIEAAIHIDKARALSQADALVALLKLEQGESIEHFKSPAKLVKVGSVQRTNTTVNNQIVIHAFTMKKPIDNKPVYKVVELSSSVAIIQLKAVTAPAMATATQLQIFSRQIQSEQANRDMAAVLGYLKSQITIVRAEDF